MFDDDDDDDDDDDYDDDDEKMGWSNETHIWVEAENVFCCQGSQAVPICPSGSSMPDKRINR
jgi:hypothetical protein